MPDCKTAVVQIQFHWLSHVHSYHWTRLGSFVRLLLLCLVAIQSPPPTCKLDRPANPPVCALLILVPRPPVIQALLVLVPKHLKSTGVGTRSRPHQCAAASPVHGSAQGRMHERMQLEPARRVALARRAAPAAFHRPYTLLSPLIGIPVVPVVVDPHRTSPVKGGDRNAGTGPARRIRRPKPCLPVYKPHFRSLGPPQQPCRPRRA